MMRVERIFLLAILATMPIIYGAVQSWIWAWYVAAVFFTFLWAYWRKEIRLKDNGFGAVWLVYLFLLWSLFQLAPLPGDWLPRLSPFRADLLKQARDLAGVKDAWPSMTYVFRIGLEQWVLWLGAVVLVMLVRTAAREHGFMASLAVMLLVVGGLEALYGLVQALVPNTGVLGYAKTGLGDARGTFINRNHFAGMMEMIWPVGLGYLLSLSPWEERIRFKHLINSDYFNRQLLIAITLVVMVLALIFSRSRAGIMGTFLGFLAFLAVIAFSGGGLGRGFWIGTGIGLFLLLIYGSRIGFQGVIDRFLALDTQGNTRLDMWRDAWLMVQQHPFGVGPGNYQVVEPIFRVHFQAETITYHTHNDYLQLLVETGWPGFLMLTSGFLYVLVRGLMGIRRMYKTAGYSTRFFVAAGAWSGLVSLAWHSYFDFNLQIPSNLFYFAMLIGIVTSSFAVEGRRDRRQGSGGGGRGSGGRGQRSDVGGRRAEGKDRGQGSEVTSGAGN